jgi:hypothetical protein
MRIIGLMVVLILVLRCARHVGSAQSGAYPKNLTGIQGRRLAKKSGREVGKRKTQGIREWIKIRGFVYLS